MLSAKPWKLDAILRLALRLIICMFAGSLLLSALQFSKVGGKAGPAVFYPLAGASMICLVAALWLAGRRWNLESAMRRLGALLACLYIGLFIGAWAERVGGGGHVPGSTGTRLFATLSLY